MWQIWTSYYAPPKQTVQAVPLVRVDVESSAGRGVTICRTFTCIMSRPLPWETTAGLDTLDCHTSFSFSTLAHSARFVLERVRVYLHVSLLLAPVSRVALSSLLNRFFSSTTVFLPDSLPPLSTLTTRTLDSRMNLVDSRSQLI